MPVEEVLVSVRGTPSHEGQPMKVLPAAVIALVRDRVVGVRLTAAFRPTPVHVVHCIAELHATIWRHACWSGLPIRR